jgi:hypothetical protein
MTWPGKYDSTRGKRSRIHMLNKLISDHGGRIKYDVLKKHLEAQGYHFLIERLQAMGFTVVDGYVQGHVHSTRW